MKAWRGGERKGNDGLKAKRDSCTLGAICGKPLNLWSKYVVKQYQLNMTIQQTYLHLKHAMQVFQLGKNKKIKFQSTAGFVLLTVHNC